MSNWLYEAANAQAQLEDARTQLNKLEKENKEMRRALTHIAEDKVETGSHKIEAQRNWFIKVAKQAVGIKTNDGF